VRAIDTETTQLAMVRTERQAGAGNPTALAVAIAQQIAATVADKYPLRGRIAVVEDDRVIINLGNKHGVAAGQAFNVIERGAPIELNGRVLGYRDSRIAQLTVTEVQDQLAYARIGERQGLLQKNQRVIARKE
jgi:D-serine deaminase-like pyridoxal phosphate-dependent protein